MRSNVHPPRVGLCLGRHLIPAIPVTLSGDRASLLFRDVPPAVGDVRLVLDWTNGSVTELVARVRLIEDDLSLMSLEVREIGGDWAPFLAYLGEDANLTPVAAEAVA